MKHYAILYISTLAIMFVLDFAWIGGIASDFYKKRMGDLLEIHTLPSIAFYLLYILGILVFVSGGDNTKWQSTLLYGALFGFFAYVTYDLTNLATLKGWSLSLAIVDILWGTFLTAIAATGGTLIAGYFDR
jgi:uncharacterized membrane protein